MRRIFPRTEWVAGRYIIVAASATAENEWNAFARRNPVAARRAYERLSASPLERQPRKQFPLRGKAFSPFWELEATEADRIWYAVDQAGLIVMVAARDDVHTSPRLVEILRNRRAAYENALAEAMRVGIKEFDGSLRIPEWALKPNDEAPITATIREGGLTRGSGGPSQN